jgi:LmbE family N-acetylglucosaminyl deacetylase
MAGRSTTTVGTRRMDGDRSLPERLLGIWAHPDDECYLSAGLMARVVAAGGAVRLLCATAGELGNPDRGLGDFESFGELRRGELAASLDVLGVTDLHMLGLGDGLCTAAAADRQVDLLRRHIAEFEPDTVITFGPDGITGHQDHLAVSSWSTAAVRPGDGAQLLYATMTRAHVERHRELHDSIGLFGERPEGRPAFVEEDGVALHCDLDDAELDRKRRALAEHRSQTESLAAIVGEDRYRTWWQRETFRTPDPAEWAAARARLEAEVPA